MLRFVRSSPVRDAVLAAACAGAVAVTSCSTEEESSIPIECRTTPQRVERSLARAPDPVTLSGVPISECFARAGQQADMQAVGLAFTGAAAGLAERARDRPGGDALLRLGYLVAAVRKGTETGGGIHDELARRLEQELIGVDVSAPAFRAGERAGRESG